MNFYSLLIFFSKSTFLKSSFRSYWHTIRVSNSLDPDQAQQMSGLIWVQTVCKSYQQRTLGDKRVKLPWVSIFVNPVCWWEISSNCCWLWCPYPVWPERRIAMVWWLHLSMFCTFLCFFDFLYDFVLAIPYYIPLEHWAMANLEYHSHLFTIFREVGGKMLSSSIVMFIQRTILFCLFLWFDSLRPINNRTGLPGLNQY